MKTYPTAEDIFYRGIESLHQTKLFPNREETNRSPLRIAAESCSGPRPFHYLPAAEWRAMQVFFPTAAQVLRDVIASQQK